MTRKLSKRMVDLAQRIASSQNDEALDSLTELLEIELLERRDRVIERALSEVVDPETLEAFIECLQDCIEEQFFELDGQSVGLTLIAIPLQLVLRATEGEQFIPESMPDIQPIAASLRPFGLFDDFTSVLLRGELYTLNDLATLDWSTLFHLPQELFQGVKGELTPLSIPREPPAVIGKGEPTIVLRFLLGLLIRCPAEAPEEDVDDDSVDVEAMCQTLTALVEDQLARPDLEVLCSPTGPTTYFDALDEGQVSHHAFALHLALEQVFSSGQDPDQTDVLVQSLDPEEDQLGTLVTIQDARTETPLLHYRWYYSPTPMAMERSVTALVDTLADCGLTRIMEMDGFAPLPILH